MTGTDAIVERILTTYDTITVVGASRAAYKAAHSVPAHMQRHGWRIIPVNPHADQLLGEPAYRTLADVPEQVGLVDVFRPSGQTPDIARQAVAAGATALWLQLGIASADPVSVPVVPIPNAAVQSANVTHVGTISQTYTLIPNAIAGDERNA